MAMTDYQAQLYDPVYAVLGVDATLTPDGGTAIGIVAIDKSAGVALPGDSEVETLVPAAVVRMAELAGNEVTAADTKGAALVMNGKNWTVDACRPKPSPNGEADGELYLILSEA